MSNPTKAAGERCPTCGRFVENDTDGYYVPAPRSSGVAVYQCCDEECGVRYEQSPEGQEVINED